MRKPMQLFKEAFDMMYQNIGLFFGILLVPVALSFVAALFGPTSAEQSVGIGASPAYLVMSLISGIVNVFMAIAVILAIQNNSISVIEAYKQSVPFFWRYILMSILMFVLLFIGFLFLLVPGIILTVWLSFSTFVLVLERGGVVESLKKSREYVRGRWWAVFGRIIVLGIGLILISMVISMVFVALPLGIVSAALVTAFTMLLAPFAVIYMYLVYQDLKGAAPAESPTVA